MALKAATSLRRRFTASTWAVDALILLILTAGWVSALAKPVLQHRPIAYDTFRDAASAEHMRVGHWSDDPSLVGYTYWYAPAGPAFYSLVCRATGASALSVYGGGILWVNVWILPASW